MTRLLLLVLLAIPAVPAAGQGWIDPVRPTPDWGVVRIRTAVTVEVVGRVAHVTVEDWFENRGGRLGEGEYIFPLPGEAVFANVSLFQGDQELRGETMDAGRAREIYETIVRQKRDPALVELVGHGLLRARVFPIAPGTERRMILRYTQVLDRAGDAMQFRYLGARHRARAGAAEAPVTVHLTVDGEASFAEPFSPTHSLEVSRTGDRLSVRVARADGALSIFLPFARETVGLALATHRTDGEPGYFMLTLSPGTAAVASSAPRDIAVVVDVSGSMSGEKIVQARAALHQLLGSLAARDRFRLIRFSNGVHSHAADWTGATPDALTAARRWVDDLRADGGTNMAGALEEAFRLPSPEERLPIVVFLTDGLPSVGERDPERLADRAARHGGRVRVFAFGVGHDVNTYLLDRLSAAGRGATEYVAPGESVERALGELAGKIRHPVLTDLRLRTPDGVTALYPTALPDLFHGDELIVFGRYEPRRGALTVTGRRNGRTERFTLQVDLARHEGANGFLPRLWAARKLGALQQTVRLEGASEALIDEIRRTALRYGLLSAYTSYLVQEPDVLAQNRPRGRHQLAPPPVSPAAASGAGAVATARADKARREVRTVADLAEAEDVLAARSHGPDARPVAGRWFVQRDGVWTDMRHGDSLRVVTVEPFSPAYFTLLESLPELRPYVTAFDQVLVTGHALSIRVAPGGTARAADVTRVVHAFRGP